MSNVRTRDYDGPRSLDPACAPDEVDTVTMCRCDGCLKTWLKSEKKKHCPVCQWSVRRLKDVGMYSEVEVPA